ncbi:hypothetical protein [Alteromonas antoniana]|uniref:hypothetical protein n=1 Tax=Alteromonas antoniana TaxID=2803813 RepID=UPI001C46FA80|nr:hypothetical protein [Alteromonas antoniana]
MKTLTQHEVAQLPGAGFTTTITCCEWNIFGLGITMDVFSYNVNWAGAIGQHYGENRMSAYNRL